MSGKEEKSWKEQADELREEGKWLHEEGEKLGKEIRAQVERSKKRREERSGQGNDGEEGLKGQVIGNQELMLRSFDHLRSQHDGLIKQHDRILMWISEFEWISRKRWWVGIFSTILATIFVTALLT